MNDERIGAGKTLILSFPHFVILSLLLLLASCYQPKEGCLDIAASNYDVSSDDPCPDCCQYPKLTVAFEHRVVLPSMPDTSFALRYDSLYPSPSDPAHYFSFLRSRFFVSNIKLVGQNAVEAGVEDSLELESLDGVSFAVVNSFVKVDRDIFQAATVGEIIAKGTFTAVKLTLGLDEALLQTNPESVPAANALSIASDTLIYEEGFGYIPNRLVFRPDTLAATDSLEFRFLTPKEVLLPLEEPFELARGFDVQLTLRINYLAWFEGVDLANDSPAEMMEKINGNLTKAISVTELKME